MQYKNLQKIKNNRGFVILFAVTVSSILLAIALGVANIALKEVRFGTSAKDTNDAFFAADTAMEYVLFNDKSPSSYIPDFGTFKTWPPIIISQLGSTNQACATVTITKDNTSPPATRTSIISKGYNTGGSVAGVCNPAINSVERELSTSY